MAAWLLSDFFHHKESGQGSVVGGPLQDISGSHSTYEEYDTSGLDRWDSYTNPDSDGSFKFFKKDKHHSGHGHSDYDYHDEECCPLVVDLLCLAAIIVSIAGATFLLSRVMQIELMTKRKRRRSVSYTSYLLEGKLGSNLKSNSVVYNGPVSA